MNPPDPTPLTPDVRRERDLIAGVRRQLLDRRTADSDGSDPPDLARPPARGAAPGPLGPDAVIPGYEILRELHRGGQGVVYLAHQRSTQRRVAIKVMRDGPFADAAGRARFEREIRILGRLHHPHIVAIHDSGQAAGCHYFVMNYVDGDAIERSADDRRLGVRERIALLGQVCEAVSAAHLIGVIHRDLKPSNIRVDVAGTPQILDFGLAKTLDEAALGGDSAPTLTGQFVGSLPWAAPEQLSGGTIDVRTDVYALGVILFQLLTGRFPYSASTAAVLPQQILEAEPLAPSRAADTELAASPAERDEIDTIVLRCLAKDPARRYQSAAELARDLRRFLAGEPIDAKRDSLIYVMRKRLRRWRVAIGVAAAFVVVLAGGLVATISAWRAAHENLVRATAAEADAQAHAAEAAAERDVALRVKDALIEMFDRADPSSEDGGAVPAHALLDEAVDRSIRRFADQPAMQAELLYALGSACRGLERYDRALALLDESLRLTRETRPGSRSEADVLEQITRALLEAGDFSKAEQTQRKAVEIRRRTDGPAGDALAAALSRLADTLSFQGRPEDAEPVHAEAEALARANRETPEETLATCLQQHGFNLARLGRIDEAAERLSEARRLLISLEKSDDLNFAHLLAALGHCQAKRGDFEAAERTLRESLRLREARCAPTHPAVATGLSNLGRLLADMGRLDEAEALLRDALARKVELLGDGHHAVNSARVALADVLARRENFTAAERELTAVLERLRAAPAPDAAQIGALEQKLAELASARGAAAGGSLDAPTDRVVP